MRSRREGFTLLEILVVLAILGIVAGLFWWNLLSTLRARQLQDAAQSVAVELKRARATAQKTGVEVAVSWTPAALTATPAGGAPRVLSLPDGVQIVTPSPGNVGYSPPFGTAYNDGEPGGFLLTVQGVTGRRLDVVALGITGQARVRAHTDP